jgi:hypothetical protein
MDNLYAVLFLAESVNPLDVIAIFAVGVAINDSILIPLLLVINRYASFVTFDDEPTKYIESDNSVAVYVDPP